MRSIPISSCLPSTEAQTFPLRWIPKCFQMESQSARFYKFLVPILTTSLSLSLTHTHTLLSSSWIGCCRGEKDNGQIIPYQLIIDLSLSLISYFKLQSYC